MKIANPKYEAFFQLGRTAFLNGKPRVPVNDKDYISLAYAEPRGSYSRNF